MLELADRRGSDPDALSKLVLAQPCRLTRQLEALRVEEGGGGAGPATAHPRSSASSFASGRSVRSGVGSGCSS